MKIALNHHICALQAGLLIFTGLHVFPCYSARLPYGAMFLMKASVKASLGHTFFQIPQFPPHEWQRVCIEGSFTQYLLKGWVLTAHGSRQGQVLALGVVAQSNKPSGRPGAGFQLRAWFACWDPSSCIKGNDCMCHLINVCSQWLSGSYAGASFWLRSGVSRLTQSLNLEQHRPDSGFQGMRIRIQPFSWMERD